MVIKRKEKAEISTHHIDDGKTAEAKKSALAYRRKIDEATFEWSNDPLPDLDEAEINELKKVTLSLSSARVVKKLMQDGLRFKQILFHLRGKRGFSRSSVSKIHAALARSKKSKT
jgi:hypothetical protein